MDRGKTKNFIILVLVTVNVFLLSLVLVDKARSLRISGELNQDIRAILEAAGIETAPGLRFDSGAPVVYAQRRAPDKERLLAASAIGEAETEDMGGNIFVYAGAGGRVTFHGTGDFVFSLADGPKLGPDPWEGALSYLRKLGLDCYYDELRPQSSPEEITVTARFLSRPVYNAKIRLTLDGGVLQKLEGTRVLDDFSESPGVETLSCPTAVMRFLDAVLEGGSLCSELWGIELGAKIEPASSGGGRLVPVWRFITDAGDFFVNGISGQMEPFSY